VVGGQSDIQYSLEDLPDDTTESLKKFAADQAAVKNGKVAAPSIGSQAEKLWAEKVINPAVKKGRQGVEMLTGRENGGEKAAVVEVELKGGKYRVHSAYTLDAGQLEIKEQKAQHGVSKPGPANPTPQGPLTQGGGVPCDTLHVEPSIGDNLTSVGPGSDSALSGPAHAGPKLNRPDMGVEVANKLPTLAENVKKKETGETLILGDENIGIPIIGEILPGNKSTEDAGTGNELLPCNEIRTIVPEVADITKETKEAKGRRKRGLPYSPGVLGRCG